MSLDCSFPVPTRSQMLCAYPKSAIKKFGHANIFHISFHKDSIDDGHGGSISDPFTTRVSKILESIPFGIVVEFDKGFLTENHPFGIVIICIRHIKKLEKHTQQTKEDTGLTQKVGKTRMVIE
ncbi:LOW QUALITY PROTEIN: hypothetical protein ACHAWF_004405 [Thalassiosira exigua]